MSKYPNTLGRIEAVWNILGGEEGVDRLLRGELMVCLPKVSDLLIWKTIRLGTGLKTADDFRTALKKAGMKVSDWGNEILGNPTFTTSETEVELDLVILSVAHLGFKGGAAGQHIVAMALEQGIELCPAEVGPQLRLQYLDQPKDDAFLIAMEPISDSDGLLSIFSIERGDSGRLGLLVNNGNPSCFWSGSQKFVFVRSRK